MVTLSRTRTVITVVEAAVRLFTSFVNLATSCAVGISSKKPGGSFRTFANISRRRSRTTLFPIHCMP